MIAEYYDVSHTQDYIHGIMDGPGTVDEQLQYYTSAEGLGKTGSYDDDGNLYIIHLFLRLTMEGCSSMIQDMSEFVEDIHILVMDYAI